jgi:hypothetical protein
MVPNVSHPGGARAHKIQRVPQFPDIGTELDMADSNVWRCVVAEESHEDTEHKFSGIASAVLTGESVDVKSGPLASHEACQREEGK